MFQKRCFVTYAVLSILLILFSDQVQAEEDHHHSPAGSLTDGFWGLKPQLEQGGIELAFSVTQIYQQNVKGGLRTGDRSGRYTGSYNLELGLDAEKLFGWKQGRFFVLAEGAWPRAEGIDPESVGSIMGVNDDAAGCRPIDVTELWYQQGLLEGKLQIRIGKMDLANGFECNRCPGAFDGSRYANDETSQFLSSALVNNPSIPFPDYSLGVMMHWEPANGWYLASAVADAQADGRETGFRTAFHHEDYFFSIFETGVTPRFVCADCSLQGVYRAGCWYDPQAKERFRDAGTKRDDMGFYFSFDQDMTRENQDDRDDQGLGLFGRYGWSSSRAEPLIVNFWSLGLQYQGLLPGRDGTGTCWPPASPKASSATGQICRLTAKP